ncbi:MAG TPA: hypothetical protein VJT80_06355 [Steroidobacteraceae bacterium]|jgi:hypothetical protein|nr:hypothetical protein [Steroidobacteraceae bacterium]
MRRRLGLLLILIPMIASAALALKESSEHARPAPAPKKLEAPHATPTESSDDSRSRVPQRPPGEVIGVPMLA